MPSIYEQRMQPAYHFDDIPVAYAENPYILSWWEDMHDAVVVDALEERRWYWPLEIADDLIAVTDIATLDAWRKDDRVCAEFAWYNVLMYFAVARANAEGWTRRLPAPAERLCRLCRKPFLETSLPYPLIRRIGLDDVRYCSLCLTPRLFDTNAGNDRTFAEVLAFVRHLTDLLQFVPPQSFLLDSDLTGQPPDVREALLRVLKYRPTVARVKALFGSWLQACIAAGVLEGAGQRTTRGIHCIALDGHGCLSLGEKTIDDWLYVRHVAHEKEPRYPIGAYRADFRVGAVLIEYFGV